MHNIRFIGASEWIKNEMGQSFLAQCSLGVIHNGIDLSVFRPVDSECIIRKYALEGKTVILGIASIWLAEKGWEDFIKLAGILKSDEQLVLVGKTDKRQQRSLPKNILHIGRTSDVHELAALYTAATVLVNPTWQDNYPTVNLESIACGTPVITYRTGGSIESITSDTGFVVPQGDVGSIAKCIETIRDNGKASYSTACRSYAQAHFNKEDRFRDYIHLYENLAAR